MLLSSESLLLPPPFITPLFSFGQEGFKALGMGDNNVNLPPGFRFYPTDEELIVHFLLRKASLLPCHPDIIPDLDLYPYEPWELQGKAWCEGRKWYFYSRKAPSRLTRNGYWHPILPEEPVFTSSSCRKVGFKQCYAFHLGESPRGIKTSWIMHEYCLPGSSSTDRSTRRKGLNKIDQSTWVLCRVYDCDDEEGGDGGGGVELSCLDEVFLSLDDMDEISLPN